MAFRPTITVPVDFIEQEIQEAERRMKAVATRSIERAINDFFEVGPNRRPIGPAAKEIDDRITNKFLSEKFQLDMAKYFEQRWETVLKESMEKAMRQAADKVAYQEVNRRNK